MRFFFVSPLRWLLSALLAWLAGPCVQAGMLDRASLAAYFPAPMIVGERDAEIPVWPLFRQSRTDQGWDGLAPVGYAFESVDFAAVPGFSGTPVNLLVALGAEGEFLDVRVLSQREPVFVVGLGPAPLESFVEQYKGLAVTQNIKIGSNLNHGGRAGSANVFIDGVSKATASVRIVNQSLLSASLQVARARLGFAVNADPGRVGSIRAGRFDPLPDVAALERAGLATRRAWRNREVEAAFVGTAGAGRDGKGLAEPDGLFTEMLAMQLNVPTVGRNLLGDKAWTELMGWIEPGDHAFLVATRGRYSFVGEDYISGAVPDRLTLTQAGLPVELRDFALDEGVPQLPAGWGNGGEPVHWRVFKVIRQAGLDPAQPLDFALNVVRSKGQVFPETVRKELTLRTVLPPGYVDVPTEGEKTWRAAWRDRASDIAVLAAGLLTLAVLLARPGWVTASPRRLKMVRHAYLAFTLGFIGWHAQGQLSIVNATALLQAVRAGHGLSFFLYDPVSLLLWAFVAGVLVLWGRGAFCGWLCPFGALQEFVASAARFFRLPRWRLPARLDTRLKALKYGVLVLVLAMPLVSVQWTDQVVEVEPFKTAITLGFSRSWPFVLWAVGLLLLAAFVHKAYCRYLCPLGAALALLGHARRLNWLPRRAECGQPCQTCRHHCEYQAIRAHGQIDYAECFQCLDCVAVYANDALCAPRLLEKRKGRVIAVRASAPRTA